MIDEAFKIEKRIVIRGGRVAIDILSRARVDGILYAEEIMKLKDVYGMPLSAIFVFAHALGLTFNINRLAELVEKDNERAMGVQPVANVEF